MWSSNQALTPDMDKQDDLVSSPYQWPLLLVGLRMCGWGDHEIKYFLLGNPVVWWGSTLSILVLSLVVLVYAIRFRRGNVDFISLGFTILNFFIMNFRCIKFFLLCCKDWFTWMDSTLYSILDYGSSYIVSETICINSLKMIVFIITFQLFILLVLQRLI